MTNAADMVRVENLSKGFTLHNRDGLRISVLNGVTLTARAHECLVLSGESGAGKSTLLRLIYANYLAEHGSVRVVHDGRWVELVGAPAPVILALREHTLGYVSQSLRVIPRINTLDLVAEPLLRQGVTGASARRQAMAMLERLSLPERLWPLPPATFSGGERQRVNIAITMVRAYPVLLLDEPTAALDPDNRRAVVDLIVEARRRGAAIIGIFHDDEVRDAVGTAVFELGRRQPGSSRHAAS